MEKEAKIKKWVGSKPDTCDICKKKIENYFIDGRIDLGVRGSGWALVCMKCWKKFGVRLGTGWGQKYSMETMEKVEG
jgi:hypothetical protein